MRSYLVLAALSFVALTACSSSTPSAPGSDLSDAAEPTEPSGGEGPLPTHTDAGTSDASQPVDAGGDATTPADAGSGAFTKAEVQALFNAKCVSCHGAAGGSGSLSLDDFETTTIGVASHQLPTMPRITKGSRATSYLFHKLANTQTTVGGKGNVMPPAGNSALSATEIEQVGKYIDAL